MGFNTVVTIKNNQLDAIAADPDFGEALRGAITYGHRERRSDGRFMTTSLSELDPRYGFSEKAYDLCAAEPHHADDTKSFVVSDHGLAQLGFSGGPSWDEIQIAAEYLAQFGYRIEHKAAKFLVEAADPPAADLDGMLAEREDLGAYETSVFDEGTTTIHVLIDGLSEISREKAMGKRLAYGVRKWWDEHRAVSDMYLEAHNARPGEFRISGHISAQNFANPISIVGVTPKGKGDLIISDGNWGRFVKPYMGMAFQGDKDHLRKIRTADIERLFDDFLVMGFHVRRPGRVKAESPYNWTKDRWIQPDEETPGSSMKP